MTGQVIRLDAHRPKTEGSRLELITVKAYGGIRLRSFVRVFGSDGNLLAVTSTTEPDAVEPLWRAVCEVLAEHFDDETSQYRMTPVDVDENGKVLPSPPAADGPA